MPRVPYIDYDYRYMLRDNIHEAGITKKGFAAMLRDLRDVQATFNKRDAWNPKKLLVGAGKTALRSISDAAKNARAKARTLVVVGIGGSDLGARALVQALSKENVKFVGATTDPVALERDLKGINFNESIINIVSKSGGTLETLAAFAVIEERLRTTFGDKKYHERIVVTTGATGLLRELAVTSGYSILDIPEEIGGRFSVLTSCGLFPAAFAGVNIEKMVGGAETVFNEVMRGAPERCAAMVFAGLHVQAYMEERIMNTILMPYNAQLEMFGMWFRQLWAESLGKAQNRRNGSIQFGLMPIVAIGPTDQHSQLQLYLDGPGNSAVTFLSIGKLPNDIIVPKISDIAPPLIRGKKMSQLLDMERRATSQALAESGRVNGTLAITKIDEEHVGALFALFMAATVIVGELLDINAFDQPAVERIKQHINTQLKEYEKGKKQRR